MLIRETNAVDQFLVNFVANLSAASGVPAAISLLNSDILREISYAFDMIQNNKDLGRALSAIS